WSCEPAAGDGGGRRVAGVGGASSSGCSKSAPADRAAERKPGRSAAGRAHHPELRLALVPAQSATQLGRLLRAGHHARQGVDIAPAVELVLTGGQWESA